MELSEIKGLYNKSKGVAALKKVLSDKSCEHIFLNGLHASAPAVVASAIALGKSNLLIVLNDSEEASYFYNDLMQLSPDKGILFLPSSYRRSIKYAQKDAANEIMRTETLSTMRQHPKGNCIVTYPDALSEKVMRGNELSDNMMEVSVGQTFDNQSLIKHLSALGFERVDYVYEPGQFAARGSIIDVFSYSFEFPFRIDFFGDEIESIRSFDVSDQLSKENFESIAIVAEILACDTDNVSFISYIEDDGVLMFEDLTWVKERFAALCKEVEEMEIESNDLKSIVTSPDELASLLANHKIIEFGNKPSVLPDAKIAFDTSAQPLFHKNFDLVSDYISQLDDKGYTVCIASDSPKQIERIRAIFEDKQINVQFKGVNKTVHEGFVDNGIHLALLTDHQIFDRFHKYTLRSDKAKSGKIAQSLKELNSFQPGDYVVHSEHGIGRFAGLAHIPMGNSTQEVMKICYQNDDVVFVSIHSLHKVSKYKGKEGESPKLSKLGTGAWERLKERTKTKIKDIARDLIKLYAQRKEEKGFEFSPDNFMQRELEASFIYEDTPDQLKATQDVKRDMEKDIPMDRLICGDVGFGKTEVAIRAAFKAVADNKQVAVLVPTTVLAYQHFQTFKARLKDFPCNIDYLSRARKAADVKRILQELKEGKINILIGTHKIIGKEVKFHDLGLLIIDEEQKFGVGVKEKLRQLKVNVDTLTMTATPIPRTLQFSLMGARDLSVISTPPPNRYPIQTEVHTFDSDIIAEAINYEMSRNGQVFFINNRIENLPELKSMIERLVPGVRVCMGHGQMEPAVLENTIMSFINFDYDVMLSTSIVESGIDIPNVNTIIINQAQNFGLSDLHQLRGRVGRSNKKAFCYLLAPPLTSLTPEAKRRLEAIESFSDLGSGIHIAMQDLDIRGAGNMLGAEQSGFIADLGYETYQKILGEAVKELKNEEFHDLFPTSPQEKEKSLEGSNFVDECTIESDWEIFFPNNYVPSSSERVLLYRELDNLKTDEQVSAFKQRLVDRFGEIPQEAEELIAVVKLKRMATQLGVEKIVLKQTAMTLYTVSDSKSAYYQSQAFGRIVNFVYSNSRRCEIRDRMGKKSVTIKQIKSVQEAIEVLEKIASTQPI